MKNSENNKQRLHHINQKTNHTPKRTKRGLVIRATTITTNNSRRHIKEKNKKKGLLKQVNLNIDISELHIKVDNSQGGNLRNNFLAWTNTTSDTFTLNIVQQGLK